MPRPPCHALRRSRLDHEIAAGPTVYVAPTEACTNLTIRYLVPARQRRLWATRLVVELSRAVSLPGHRGRIAIGYPRTLVELERGGAPGAE